MNHDLQPAWSQTVHRKAVCTTDSNTVNADQGQGGVFRVSFRGTLLSLSLQGVAFISGPLEGAQGRVSQALWGHEEGLGGRGQGSRVFSFITSPYGCSGWSEIWLRAHRETRRQSLDRKENSVVNSHDIISHLDSLSRSWVQFPAPISSFFFLKSCQLCDTF